MRTILCTHIQAKSLFVATVVTLLSACGGGGSGGGGGGGGGSSTPTISNLQYSPSSAFVATGPAVVSGTVQFSDLRGDLASLNLTTSAGAGQAISLSAAAGQTTGTLQGVFQIDTSLLGHYTFDIWVVDSGGSASNHLTGIFDVLLDDLAQHWTLRNPYPTPQLNKVIWAGNRFVAVGYTGTIVTSPDGDTWTAQASGTQAVLTGVTWTGTQYVAVGNDFINPVVLTSPDAATWTVSASSLPGSSSALLDLTGVASSGMTLVALGINQGDNTGRIFTSVDAVTWTPVSPNPAAQLTAIIWTGSEFVAAGSTSNGPAVLRSPDGAVWTSDTISGSGRIFDLVSAGSGASQARVAVGSAIWINSSGSGWQIEATPTNFNGFAPNAVGWSGNHYLACIPFACASSADGQQWSATAANPVSPESVIWGGPGLGRWVAVGFGGAIATSP